MKNTSIYSMPPSVAIILNMVIEYQLSTWLHNPLEFRSALLWMGIHCFVNFRQIFPWTLPLKSRYDNTSTMEFIFIKLQLLVLICLKIQFKIHNQELSPTSKSTHPIPFWMQTQMSLSWMLITSVDRTADSHVISNFQKIIRLILILSTILMFAFWYFVNLTF